MTIGTFKRGAGSLSFLSGLGIAQICSWGTLYYSFPLIAEAMEQELGWSKATLYGALTIGIIFSAALAYPIGVAIDRGGGRYVMAGGSIAAGLLLVLWSSVDSLALYYVVVAGLGAMQAATLYDPAFAVVARQLGSGNARSGILAVSLWGGFASTVFVPLVQFLLASVGWRATLFALAGVNIFICAGIYFAIIDPNCERGDTRLEEGPRALKSDVWGALTNPVFWLLAVAFTTYSASMTAFIFHLYPFLTERNFNEVTIGTIIMVIGPAQVAGRLLILRIGRQSSIRRLGSLSAGLLPVSILCIWLSPQMIALMLAGAVLYGAVNGVMTIVRGMAIPEMVSRNAYGALNGMLGIPIILAKALAPLGVAGLWSLGSSYRLPMLAIVITSLMMAAAFWAASILSKRNGFD